MNLNTRLEFELTYKDVAVQHVSHYVTVILSGGFDACCLVEFYGISTFVGYLTPNPFLFLQIVQLQTIQFSMSSQFVKNISISSYTIYSNILI